MITRWATPLLEALAHCIPVDGIPPGGDVIRSPVLILQIVGMLPHVEPQERSTALHDRGVLVRGTGDLKLATVGDKPCPTAAEARGCCLGELLFEGSKAAEGRVDRICQSARRLATGVWSQDFPEQRVVGMAAAVVAHCGPDALRHTVEITDQLLNTLALQIGCLLKCRVQVIDVGSMMLIMVDAHRLLIDVRLQGSVIIR